MKVVLILAVVSIASAATLHPLSSIGVAFSGNIAVTSDYPDNSAYPTLASVTYPTTYDSSAPSPALFSVAGNGLSFGNNTVQFGNLVFTNANDVVTVPLGATASVNNGFVLAASSYPKFLNSAIYTASVQLTTLTLGVYTVTPTTALLSLTATKFTPQTLASLRVISPQSAGCDGGGCAGSALNATAFFTPTGVVENSRIYLRASTVAAAGGVFSVETSVTPGTGGANFLGGLVEQSVVFSYGGLQNGIWQAADTNSPTLTQVPTGATFALSASTTDNYARVSYFNEATTGAFQATAVLMTTTDAPDITAPTCNLVTVEATTLITQKVAVLQTVVLSCADETGGSGFWTSGFFYTFVTSTGNTVSGVGFNSISIAPFVSGTINIVGVFAVDNGGNAALYGSCAGVVGYDSLGCGGGSSSASSVVVSLFAFFFVALSSLFA